MTAVKCVSPLRAETVMSKFRTKHSGPEIQSGRRSMAPSTDTTTGYSADDGPAKESRCEPCVPVNCQSTGISTPFKASKGWKSLDPGLTAR